MLQIFQLCQKAPGGFGMLREIFSPVLNLRINIAHAGLIAQKDSSLVPDSRGCNVLISLPGSGNSRDMYPAFMSKGASPYERGSLIWNQVGDLVDVAACPGELLQAVAGEALQAE